jgi:hypothetical protein
MAGTGEQGDSVLWTSDGSVNAGPHNDVGDAFIGIVHAVESRYEDGSPATVTLALLVPGIQAVLWKRGVQHGARALVGADTVGATVAIAGLRTVTGADSIPRREHVPIPAPPGTWRRTDE